MQLLGVYDDYLAAPLAQVLISLGVKRGMVVYGQDKLDEISMSAPTSENRIAMIAKEATGFLYIVSSLCVTGTRRKIKTDLRPSSRWSGRIPPFPGPSASAFPPGSRQGTWRRFPTVPL